MLSGQVDLRRGVEERGDLRGFAEVSMGEVSTSARPRDLRAFRLCARRIPPVMDDYGGAGLGESERNRRADAA